MLFNSLEFLIFFPIVVSLHFALPKNLNWFWLLAMSYYFYAFQQPVYLVLLIISTLIDYWAGLKMGANPGGSGRKKYLILSIIGNIGLLGGFKYFPSPDVVMPIGLSFYTFQSFKLFN